MAAQHDGFLTDEQKEQFLSRGHVCLKGAIPRPKVEAWAKDVWTRLGYDQNDKATWEQARIHMPTLQSAPVQEFSPQAWGAICELLGGEDRIKTPATWGDGFIVNLGTENHKDEWESPSEQKTGWHKDGDFFRHFLDSPEQGLLTIILWSDVLPSGGSTYVACDSVAPLARYLAARPEGVLPNDFPFADLAAQCRDKIEATGQAGDVYLLHPYLLHASSLNKLRLARLITNPPVHLREPMQFNRANPDDFSLVEKAVLRGLGVERLDFVANGSREKVVPKRVQMQAAMREAEQARLAAAAGTNAAK